MVVIVGLLLAACYIPWDAAAQNFAGTNLSLNGSTYYTLLSDAQTRAPGQYVFSVGYTRTLGSQETVSVTLSGTLSALFTALRSGPGYTVFTSAVLPSGRYPFGVIAYLTVTGGYPSLVTVAAIVEVFSQNHACVNQTFGICSQICTECNISSTCKYGYLCSCLEGYSLQLDGYSCLVNEPPPLLLFPTSGAITLLDPFITVARQLGLNTSSFACSYRQHAIFFVSDNNSSIAMYSMDTGRTTMLPSNTASPILELAVDPVDGNLLFCTEGAISKLYLSVGLVMRIVTAPSPRAITVYTQNHQRFLLWAEGHLPGPSDIKVSSIDGSNITVVVSGALNVVDITVDVVTGRLYWATLGKVQRSNLDGSALKDVYVSQVGTLVGVAVFEDFAYVLTDHGTILKIDKFSRQGSFPLVCYSSPRPVVGYGNIHVYHPLNEPVSIPDLCGCSVNNGGCSHFCLEAPSCCGCPSGYVLDNSGKTCISKAVCDPLLLSCEQGCVNTSTAQCTCNPGYHLLGNGACADVNECLTSGVCSHLCTNTKGSHYCSCPGGLFLSSDLRTCSGCSLNNGGCSQLCMTSSDLTAYSCLCLGGYQLSNDGVSCVPNDVSQLLFSTIRRASQVNRGTVVKARIDGYFLDTLVDSISVADSIPTGLIYGMDFDLEHQVLYYGDRNSSSLWEVPLSREGEDNRLKLLDGVHAWSIAYDWVHRYLYWTDDMHNHVGRTSLYPVGVAETVISNLQVPCGLALDPFQGYLYWTEAGVSPRISRSLLNGSHVEVLFAAGLVRPLGLTLDLLGGTVFWADPGKQTIEYSTLSGRGRGVFASGGGVWPFQLALYRGYLIWTSMGGASYHVADVRNSSVAGSLAVENILGETFPLYGLAAVNQNRRLDVSVDPCQPSPCPQGSICTALGRGNFTCGCPPSSPSFPDVNCNRFQFCTIEPCGAGGLCLNCTCAPGYSGRDCSIVVGQCSCLNGATCVREGNVTSCVCPQGYRGSSCGTAVCESPCMNGATCVSPGICACTPTFTGPTCSQRMCSSDYCLNGGTCSVSLGTNLQCRCPSTTTGDRCQYDNIPMVDFQTKAAAIGAPTAAVVGLLIILVSVIAVFVCMRFRRRHQEKLQLKDNLATTSETSCTKSCVHCEGLGTCRELVPSAHDITANV